MFTCPYCHKQSVPAPAKNERYQTCTNCGKRPRAVRSFQDGKLLIGYVSTAHAKKDPRDVKKSQGVKASENTMQELKKRGFDTAQQFFDYCVSLDISRNRV